MLLSLKIYTTMYGIVSMFFNKMLFVRKLYILFETIHFAFMLGKHSSLLYINYNTNVLNTDPTATQILDFLTITIK